VSNPDEFRPGLITGGVWSRFAFVGMVVLRSWWPFPREPSEIGAGYAFGIWEGTLLCLAGIIIGSIIIFVLVRRFGVKLVEVLLFQRKDNVHALPEDRKRVKIVAFFVMLIPGTPKDLLSYFVGLTDYKLSVWIIIVAVARIPSVITSTVGGGMLGMKNYEFAILTFALTLLISGCGLLMYNRITKAHKARNNN
jgi:uncharacterized membrane protein YdjX (TVP38/TMEM64 family)